MNPKHTLKYIGLWLIIVLLAACSTVPVTGRRQLDLVPSDQIISMSADRHQEFMTKHEVILSKLNRKGIY